MKVYVFPADQTGCGYYRMIWPATALKELGWDITVVPTNAEKFLRATTMEDQSGAPKVIECFAPRDADVIVFQRVLSAVMAQCIPLLRKLGKTVIVDMDDDLQAIHPGNPAFRAFSPRNNVRYNWEWAMRACRWATTVTATTQPLLNMYAPAPERGFRIENYVPGGMLRIPHTDSAKVLWGGSLFSHPDDLQQLGTSITRLQRRGMDFGTVGDPAGVSEALRLTSLTSHGPRDIRGYHTTLAAQGGIGLAPLADTRFNAAKSWLKVLEYAACGLVPVASPRPEYNELIAQLGGFTCRKPNDWYRVINDLVSNKADRVELSQLVRSRVEAFTLETNVWRWADAWQQSYKITQDEHYELPQELNRL